MKFLISSDILHLLKNRKKILFVIMVIPLIVTLINSNLPISLLKLFHLNTGTNLGLDSGPLEYILYALNISSYIFLVVDLYIKDIKYQLENIFLREKPFVWICKKTILFIIIMFGLKLLQYLIVGIVVFVKNDIFFDKILLDLILVDFIYVSLIGFGFLLIYLSWILCSKIKIIPFIMILLLLVLLPNNIWMLKNKILLMIAVLLIIQLTIGILFKKYNKKIIQNL